MARFLKSNEPLLVIIGPSGSGKSTITRMLVNHGLIEVTPSWTTRPARPGEEKQPLDHCFVKKSAFALKEKEGFFLESLSLFGLPYRYGLPRITAPKDNRVAAIILRASLIPLVKKYYSNYRVYQIEDAAAKIAPRLAARRASPGSRLIDYESELALGRKLATRIFINNGTVSLLAKNIKRSIINDFQLKL